MKKIRYIIGLCAILWCWSVRSQVNDKIVCDTIRWRFEAVAGDMVHFTFSGDVGATFFVDWGDGDTCMYLGKRYIDEEYYLSDTGAIIEARHIYNRSQSYEVALNGEVTVEEVASGRPCYVETALGLEMPMVYVQGGTFLMGGTSEQWQPSSCEKPVHSVTLDGFYIGAFEVTQAQWAAVMGTNPCSGSSCVGDNYPVYYVSWNDAVEFSEKLSAQTGKTYRLPTEAEWEYAARGGQHRDGTQYAGAAYYIGDVAWYMGAKHPVGQKKPNGLGLYDMSGNVWEWCSDWYGENYYSSSPSINPQGPSSGSNRVYRGGGVAGNPYHSIFRVSHRSSDTPGTRSGNVGFRVVCEP